MMKSRENQDKHIAFIVKIFNECAKELNVPEEHFGSRKADIIFCKSCAVHFMSSDWFVDNVNKGFKIYRDIMMSGLEAATGKTIPDPSALLTYKNFAENLLFTKNKEYYDVFQNMTSRIKLMALEFYFTEYKAKTNNSERHNDLKLRISVKAVQRFRSTFLRA